jgi:phospholipase D1/2
MQHVTGLVRSRTTTEILLTASEAYPAFERAVQESQSEIWASFRIFDPSTRLRTPEARAVGETWFDLIADALRRGVAIHLALADFDPVAKPSLHRGTWSSLRKLWAAAEAAGPRAAPLRAVAALHPAVTGFLPRAACWPQAAMCLSRTARWLNAQDPELRSAALRDMPGLWSQLRVASDGTVHVRRWGLPRLHPRPTTRSSPCSTGSGCTSAGSTSTSGAGTRPSTTAPARKPGRTSSFSWAGRWWPRPRRISRASWR